MQRLLPVIALFVLAPIVAEVLLGATPISHIGGLVPLSLLYGGGAVLIRELARRRSGGWARIALLGVAYAIVEEGLAIQSFFNPDLFQAGLLGGRAFGVNWVWTEWTVGYHVLWSIIIPILLAELLFPARRAEPWLGKAGVVAAAVAYALGALAIAVIFRRAVAPDFQAPAGLMVGAALLAAGLAALALGWPAKHTAASPTTTTLDAAVAEPTMQIRRGPSPWLVALVALLMAVAWFGLFALPDALHDGALALAAMLGELALAGAAAALLAWWSLPGKPWSALHRLAIVCGALPVSTAFSFLVTAGSPVDQLGQGVAGIIAGVLLALFAWRLAWK
jgi:hypothetical protein